MDTKGTLLRGARALALTGCLVVAGCSDSPGGPAPDDEVSGSSTAAPTSTTGSVPTTSRTPLYSPTSRPPPQFSVGERIEGNLFAFELLEHMQDKTFAITTTTAEREVSCVGVAGQDGMLTVLDPVDGVSQVLVDYPSYYVEDRPGDARPWYRVDAQSGDLDVPSQAIADSVNMLVDVWRGDCGWDDRLRAIDSTAQATVTSQTTTGWVVEVPTDSKSQRNNSSATQHTYEPGTWTISRSGVPTRYEAGDGSRVVTWDPWSGDPLAAPAAELVRD